MNLIIKFKKGTSKIFNVTENTYALNPPILKLTEQKNNTTYHRVFNFDDIKELVLIEDEEK